MRILRVDARWLYMYLARSKKKKKIRLIQGMGFLSILLNFEVLYNTNSEWYWFVQWYKILHSVKDQHSPRWIEL